MHAFERREGRGPQFVEHAMFLTNRAAGHDHVLRGDAVLGLGDGVAVGKSAAEGRREVGHDLAQGNRQFAAERPGQRFGLLGGGRAANGLGVMAFQPRARLEAVHPHATVAIADFDAHFLDVVEVAREQVDRDAEPQLDKFFVRKQAVGIGGRHVATFGRAAKIESDRRLVGPGYRATSHEHEAAEPDADGWEVRKHRENSGDPGGKPRRRAPLGTPTTKFITHGKPKWFSKKKNPGLSARAGKMFCLGNRTGRCVPYWTPS